MVRLAEGLVREGLRARLVLQMHDELVLEVPPDELGAARRVTTRAMTGPWPLDLALEVRIGVGPTWAEAHG
jgi:DNA polymerase-1